MKGIVALGCVRQARADPPSKLCSDTEWTIGEIAFAGFPIFAAVVLSPHDHAVNLGALSVVMMNGVSLRMVSRACRRRALAAFMSRRAIRRKSISRPI